MTRPHVLIAALSGRALAESAVRAGYWPLVADVFGDSDTRAAAVAWCSAGTPGRGLSRRRLPEALASLAGGRAPIGLVYGSGFEERPRLLAAVTARCTLLGNDAVCLARSKDPLGFAELCREHDVPHPETALEARPGWLSKRIGGSGGQHISAAQPGARPGRGRYTQRRVAGRPVSALFLGNGFACTLIGFSAQWTAPLPRRPYRYGGAIRPARVAGAPEAAMRRAIARLVPPLGLRGLNSADFLLRDDGFDLIEVNPRPGATLDLFPDERGQLFAQHVAACMGALPPEPPPAPGAAAAVVVYAPHALRVPAAFRWPAWASDHTPPGTPVAQHAPLCTVRAEADEPDDARALLRERECDILAGMAAP